MAAWVPERPVAVVVAYGPGSANDILVRLLAPELAVRLGQPVLVENRPGAGGTVGTAAAARARPDGHTLALVSTATLAINPALYRNLPYDPLADFLLLGLVADTPNLLVVPRGAPQATPAALAARLAGGGPVLRYASPGNGTTQHLAAVQFARLAGGEADHVPYRGPAEAVAAVAAGEVDFAFVSLPSALGLAREGALRPLGITGDARFPTLPEVAPLTAQGFPALEHAGVWFGLAVPRGTPGAVVAALRAAVAALHGHALASRLAAAGYAPLPPRDAAAEHAFVTSQATTWGDLVRRSGATLD